MTKGIASCLNTSTTDESIDTIKDILKISYGLCERILTDIKSSWLDKWQQNLFQNEFSTKATSQNYKLADIADHSELLKKLHNRWQNMRIRLWYSNEGRVISMEASWTKTEKACQVWLNLKALLTIFFFHYNGVIHVFTF